MMQVREHSTAKHSKGKTALIDTYSHIKEQILLCKDILTIPCD